MYKVIVGNIGTVYHGTDFKKANQVFKEYRRQSIDNYGRAAWEDVTMFEDDEIRKEYIGKINRNNKRLGQNYEY